MLDVSPYLIITFCSYYNCSIKQFTRNGRLEVLTILTLIWVGFLVVRFEVRGRKLPPPPRPLCKNRLNYARNLKFGT